MDTVPEGMTLRDYFAAKVMAVMMSDLDCTPNHPDGKPTTSGWPPVDAARRYDEALAYQAYRTADAMLAYRAATATPKTATTASAGPIESLKDGE